MVSGDILEEDKRLVYGGASYPFSSSSSLFSSSSRLRGVEGGSDDVDTGTRSSSSSSRRSSGGYIGALNAKIMTAGLGIVLIGLSALAVLQNDASNMEVHLITFLPSTQSFSFLCLITYPRHLLILLRCTIYR